MKRYLEEYIKKDLAKKMVFLGGPRQVGKSTLGFILLNDKLKEKSLGYFTWDSAKDRKKIINEELPFNQKLIVFDEIHKYSKWRNLIKGIYDKNKSSYQFLITGSARLDYYRRGGDSLQGRYHYYRLHPISLGELINQNQSFNLDDLFNYGGFPEVFFAKNKEDWQRWQNERLTRVINEDLVSLERVQDVSSISLLADLLPSKVGSTFSYQSLAEDLEVANKSVKRWVEILKNLYFCFMISPYGNSKIRSLKKDTKLYLWDWSLCENNGAKFENMLACQLLKYCHFIEDTTGQKMELRYIRDTDKRELDFVVLKNNKPEFAVEAKINDKVISPHIYYFKDRFKIPEFYQVNFKEESYQKDGIKVLNFTDFIEEKKLP